MVMSSCEESCELLAIVRFGELLICPVGPMVIGPSICTYPLWNVNEPLLESVWAASKPALSVSDCPAAIDTFPLNADTQSLELFNMTPPECVIPLGPISKLPELTDISPLT